MSTVVGQLTSVGGALLADELGAGTEVDTAGGVAELEPLGLACAVLDAAAEGNAVIEVTVLGVAVTAGAVGRVEGAPVLLAALADIRMDGTGAAVVSAALVAGVLVSVAVVVAAPGSLGLLALSAPVQHTRSNPAIPKTRVPGRRFTVCSISLSSPEQEPQVRHLR